MILIVASLTITNDAQEVKINVYFPDIVYIKSSGSVNETQFSRMNFFTKITNMSHNERPIWSNGGNFLFYNGKI